MFVDGPVGLKEVHPSFYNSNHLHLPYTCQIGVGITWLK